MLFTEVQWDVNRHICRKLFWYGAKSAQKTFWGPYMPVVCEGLQQPLNDRSLSRKSEGFQVKPQRLVDTKPLEGESTDTKSNVTLRQKQGGQIWITLEFPFTSQSCPRAPCSCDHWCTRRSFSCQVAGCPSATGLPGCCPVGHWGALSPGGTGFPSWASG